MWSFFRWSIAWLSVFCSVLSVKSGEMVPTQTHPTTSMISPSIPRPPRSIWQLLWLRPAPITLFTSLWPIQTAYWPSESSGAFLWCTHCSPFPNDFMSRCWALCCAPPCPCSIPLKQVPFSLFWCHIYHFWVTTLTSILTEVGCKANLDMSVCFSSHNEQIYQGHGHYWRHAASYAVWPHTGIVQ